MKKTFTSLNTNESSPSKRGLGLRLGLMAIVLFFASAINGQVLIPASGSNTVNCGTNTRLLDHAGTGNYSDNVDGFTVIMAGFQGVINIQGPYQTESCCDPIRIYSGAGTSGPILATYLGTGNINFTGTPGQTLTVRFTTDGSVVYSGLDFTVTSTGACFATPCSGAPGSNTVAVTPTVPICPGSTAALSLLAGYNVGGLTYQWQSSTISNVGPFTSIPNATASSYVTPTLSTPVYYTAVITCTNGMATTTAVSSQVMIAGTTIDNVPYYESVENIVNTNQLPNCSWTSTSPGTIARTYTATQTQQRTARTGSKFGSFYYNPTGVNYFYSNGIQLYAGVTYSASIWYMTDYYGYLNWTDLSLLLGTTQSSTGLVPIASTNGPAASSAYKALANTFTVATSGVYYVAIRATSGGNGYAQHLNWDDLRIEAPCTLNPVNLGVTASNTTICKGEQITLTAGGASTYTWSHGPTSDNITENPNQNTLYTVVGTNTATGCMNTTSQFVVVNEVPQIAVFSDKQTVCAGQPAVITAVGATSYTWSSNSNNNFITVNPLVPTTYSVYGGNQFGCTAMVSQMIGVNPLPTVTATSDRQEICKGETAQLSANGATSYSWSANTLFIQSATAFVSPHVTTTYTLTGMNANGCTGMMTITETVQECVGVKEITTTLAGVKVYPNPTGGLFTVELNNSADKTIEVLDITGRVVLTNASKEETISVNINALANGIYYVKIQSNNAVEVIKVVKN